MHPVTRLLPVRNNDNSATWLDTFTPIYRTIDHVEQRPVRRCGDKSLAIIYQDEDIFFEMARMLKRELHNSKLEKIDLYNGGEFVNGHKKYVSLLTEVFHKHRAVLFLGHLHRGRESDEGGWSLTREKVLKMSDLGKFLGAEGKHRGSTFIGKEYGGSSPIPEVVFANCCFSAGEDPESRTQEALSYPKLFLDAGVRFFIGTSMDIVLSAGNMRNDLDIIQRLVCEFFSSWADTSDKAIEHLYHAKEKCNFHLLTSLYQIYSVGGEQLITHGRKEPLGALVSGISAGDKLGDYLITKELWSERYARTFWAKNLIKESYHLVQVLVDEWQDKPGLTKGLQTAIQKFTEAGLSPGHLVPNRHQVCMLIRQGKEQRNMHVIVYDRPSDDSDKNWYPLGSRSFNQNSSSHFMEVLRIGAGISAYLSELHAKKIQHGNLDSDSILFHKDGGIEQVVIKDAWVRHALPGRFTDPRYAAPEEPANEEGIDELKYDCWGLGVILFELATGKSPFGEAESSEQGLRYSLKEALGPTGHLVPEALDRVIRECLVPSANLRPSAELIAKRLVLAYQAGGTYISEFETELDIRIQAGHRLFAVIIDDVSELESILISMTKRQHRRLPANTSATNHNISYRLFVMSEEVGLVDQRSGNLIVPWVNAQELYQLMHEQAAQNNLPSPGFPSYNEVAVYNAEIIFSQVTTMLQSSSSNDIPIVLIRGSTWWDYGPPAWRILKMCQSNPRTYPIIIVADSLIPLDPELGRLFSVVNFPPPSPAVLFEHILAFKDTEQLTVPDACFLYY